MVDFLKELRAQEKYSLWQASKRGKLFEVLRNFAEILTKLQSKLQI